MKIQFCGTSAVDIPGVDDVQPGEVVEVADEVGASLLTAGASFADDGSITPAESPLWVVPQSTKAAKAETPAAAGEGA